MIDIAEVEIKKSARRSLAVTVRPDGSVLVRAPYRVSSAGIQEFLRANEIWIDKHVKMALEKKKTEPAIKPLTNEELKALAKEALKVIPQRVAYFAPIVGVTYGKITIRNQRTRWGSCSAKGNLNFNCLLMLTPPEVIDSVVVHELCHRLEMNHSRRFYDNVLRVMPDYKKWDKWIKSNGNGIMRRMTGE